MGTVQEKKKIRLAAAKQLLGVIDGRFYNDNINLIEDRLEMIFTGQAKPGLEAKIDVRPLYAQWVKSKCAV